MLTRISFERINKPGELTDRVRKGIRDFLAKRPRPREATDVNLLECVEEGRPMVLAWGLFNVKLGELDDVLSWEEVLLGYCATQPIMLPGQPRQGLMILETESEMTIRSRKFDDIVPLVLMKLAMHALRQRGIKPLRSIPV